MSRAGKTLNPTIPTMQFLTHVFIRTSLSGKQPHNLNSTTLFVTQALCYKVSRAKLRLFSQTWLSSCRATEELNMSSKLILMCLFKVAKLFIKSNVFIFTGAIGQAACPSVMKQRRVRIPQRRAPCSSSGPTPVPEPCSGLTQQTNYPRSKPSSRGTATKDTAVKLVSS